MTKTEILFHLQEFNKDELFYQKYYNAQSQKWMFDKFLKEQNTSELIKRQLIVPELSTSFNPTSYLSKDFFENDNTNCIVFSKHNRFTPPFTHYHDFYEMIYIFEGACTQEINLDSISLKKGDFCIITPGTHHSISVFDPSLVINILIRKNTFEDIFFNLIRENNTISFYFNQTLHSDLYNDYLIFSTENDADIQDLILEMILEFKNHKKYCDSILNSMMMILFSIILTKYETTVKISQERQHSDIKSIEILTYIENNYQNITLQELADHFHFSIQYCSRLLKQTTGQTFSKILQSIRFNRAKTLLKTTNISIADISTQVGFQNPEHFNRCFKKLFKITPGEYRKNKI